MISIHVKLENEYLKLNDFIEEGNITWGKNGDDGVSVTLKNVPNGKNLLADTLGRELVAYRGGELCWKGFVNNITENENGIELIGRGDFHKFDYIEDYKEFFSKSDFEGWTEASAENSHFFTTPPWTGAPVVNLSSFNLIDVTGVAWEDRSGNDHKFDLYDVNLTYPNILYKNYKYLRFDNISYGENYTFTSTRASETIFLVFKYADSISGDILTFGDYPTLNGYKISCTGGVLTVAFRSGSTVTASVSNWGSEDALSTLALVFDSSNNLKIYANTQLVYNNTISKGTAPNANVKMGTFTATSTEFVDFLELKIFDREMSFDELESLYNYYLSAYSFDSFYPSNNDAIVYHPGFNVVKGSVSFENNCYINVANGFTFSPFDAVVVSYKIPKMATRGANFIYFEVNKSLPGELTSFIEIYDDKNQLLETTQTYSLDYGYLSQYQDSIYSINIVIANPFGASFTNNFSDNQYFVNVRAYRIQYSKNVIPSEVYGVDALIPVLNEEYLGNYRRNIYVTKEDIYFQGQIIKSYNLTPTFYVIGYNRINEIEESVYNGNPVYILKLVNSDQAPDAIELYGLRTNEIVNDICTQIDSALMQVILGIKDDIANGDFEVSKPIDILNQLAENINYKWYVHAGVFYFIKDPPQTYYLQQSSKNVSQSFDNVYTRIRTKFKNIYGFDDVSSYAEPPNRYSIVKSKSVEQQTMSRSLAAVIAETVAEENARNVVKVIPQTGELYNEYGAVVRDPKPNSAVVLKNVVPELIGLGDKTYYLSEIKYNFTDGTYEYVIDEPELTFELILGRAQNGN